MEKEISAKIIADSINSKGDRITSYILHYPKFIHSELMTHRMFSRNAASSRAIPFEKMIKMVEENPFIPIAWQKDHKGMQGTEYIEKGTVAELAANRAWLRARNNAIKEATELNDEKMANVTKQLCNRLLEPFMWYTTLVTATEWENFFELRCPQYYYEPENKYFKSRKDYSDYWFENFGSGIEEAIEGDPTIWWLEQSKSGAEIHIQALAEAMWDARNESTPKQLKPGEWHVPFGDKLLNIPDFDYTKTQEKDLEFHKHRIMFIIKDEKVITAPQGTYKSHTEYFGDTTGLIRGFRWNDEVYTYMDKFIPIESEIAAKYFEGLTCYAGAKDFFHYKYGENTIIKIATARCARLSYMTFDGEIDYEKDIKLHDRLLNDRHHSPFEHCAKALTEDEYNYLYKSIGPDEKHFQTGWCNNFRGFMSYRHIVENPNNTLENT